MFDRIKALEHTEEEIKNEDLKEEEDTSAEAGQSAENESESEEDTFQTEDTDEEVTISRAELQRLVSDRDNYKQGLLVAKAKKRTIEPEKPAKPDANREVVLKVLYEENEKKVLKKIISPDSDSYIPELVDDMQYQEIIGYLPRNFDKSSEGSIVKALKMATKLWKEDKGIKDKPAKTALNDVSEPKSGNNNTETKERKRILPRPRSYKEWY